MLEFMRFWKISRNRLAGDESLPGGSSVYAGFAVLRREPPGGTLPAARRCMRLFTNFWILMKGLAVLIQPPGDVSKMSRF